MDDYKQRCKEEYDVLCKRINKLNAMLLKWKFDSLDFVPKCPYYLLSKQLDAMIEYREVLEARNYIEGMWEVD